MGPAFVKLPGEGEKMKDIPLFTTENGAANLILGSVQGFGTAYVRVLSARDGKALAAECAQFCRAAGAEGVYATGLPEPEGGLLSTEIWRMTAQKVRLPQTQAMLEPVTAETLEKWAALYNRKFRTVPNAVWLSPSLRQAVLKAREAFFVTLSGQTVGIAKGAESEIHAVAALAPGGGRAAVLALARKLEGPEIALEVASVNQKALALYQSLGFRKTETLAKWYKIG